jgi:hypothetical protein
LLLIGGNNLDEGCPPSGGNVVAPILRSKRSSCFCSSSLSAANSAKFVSSRMVATTMNVCAAAGFGVIDMVCPFDGG